MKTHLRGDTQAGKRRLRAKRFNWLQIKREYITDITATATSLAKKHGVSEMALRIKSAQEKWALLREEVQRKAELSLADDAEMEIREVKKRHVRISRLMQKIGLEALEKFKYLPKNSKEAREFLIEGIKLEKQSMGLDQNKNVPAIVNIVNKEKEIIGKYVGDGAEEGEIIDESK